MQQGLTYKKPKQPNLTLSLKEKKTSLFIMNEILNWSTLKGVWYLLFSQSIAGLRLSKSVTHEK